MMDNSPMMGHPPHNCQPNLNRRLKERKCV